MVSTHPIMTSLSEGPSHRRLIMGKYLDATVSVMDQGRGISPENVARVFYPYFSTKGEGKGLGLSTALSITKRYGAG